MRYRNTYISIFIILFLSGCSTTRLIPEGEMLYTGTKKIETVNPDHYYITHQVESQVTDALSKAPNNALLGSNYIKIPFPFGLWIYNSFKTEKEKGFKHWIFKKFATDPILVSDVDPALRSKVAETLMDDNGYFDGNVAYEIIKDKKNPKKAYINYFVDYSRPYRYSTVEYISDNTPADSLIETIKDDMIIKDGDIFNVNALEDERVRISKHLRQHGFYYFRPDFISYAADSLMSKGEIALRIRINEAVPPQMLKPWYVSDIAYSITNSYGRAPNDTVCYRDMDLYFRNRLPLRKKVLYNSVDIKHGDLYKTTDVDQLHTQLNRLNTFKFVDISFTPQDSLLRADSLKMTINTSMDLPYDAELEFNVTAKSNKQIGPGAIFGLTKRNIFGGGEILRGELRASYEWQTGEGTRNKSGNDLINSYEFGGNISLTFPGIVGPRFLKVDKIYPSNTVVKLNADLLNRAGFFKLMNFGGAFTYNFSSSDVSTHSVTPFSLTYNYLMNTSAIFDTIMMDNQALSMSFKNQFIPSMSYTYTFDNSSVTDKKGYIWWQTSVVSAGNILYGVMDLLGNKDKHDKKIFGNQFSQFAKIVSEFRYSYKINNNQTIATRVIGGVVKPYLNSKVVPYNEQFFIGGANSLRGFGVRTVGPGSYHPASNALYSYHDQTGNLKLEANIEYRFRIMGNLFGALFADAGNVWLLENDDSSPGGKFELKNFGEQLATDFGIGLRYDISLLVIRFDVGFPIHAPYETGKSGYVNIEKPFRNLGYHIAIGYPF